MPMFRFVVRGPQGVPQADPVEHVDLAAAQAEAVDFAAAILSDLRATFWDEGEVQIDVLDDTGAPRCTLTITGCVTSLGAEPS